MEDQASTRPFQIGDVKGRRVIDTNGDNVGKIRDVVIEPGTWKVGGFVVSLRRDVAAKLRLERSTFGSGPNVEVPTERVRTVGENVILNVGRDEIGDSMRMGEAAAGEA